MCVLRLRGAPCWHGQVSRWRHQERRGRVGSGRCYATQPSPGSRSCHPISCGKVFLCGVPTEFGRLRPRVAAAHLPPPPLLPYITTHPSGSSSFAHCALLVCYVTTLSARFTHVLTLSPYLITMSGSVIISDLETLQNSKNSLAAARNKFFARKIHKLKKVCITSTLFTLAYLLVHNIFKHHTCLNLSFTFLIC